MAIHDRIQGLKCLSRAATSLRWLSQRLVPTARTAAVHPQGFLHVFRVEGERLLEQGLQLGQEGVARVEAVQARAAGGAADEHTAPLIFIKLLLHLAEVVVEEARDLRSVPLLACEQEEKAALSLVRTQQDIQHVNHL